MGGNKAILLLFVATLNVICAAQTPSLRKVTAAKDVKRVSSTLKVKKGSLRDGSASDDTNTSASADNTSAAASEDVAPDVQESVEPPHPFNEEYGESNQEHLTYHENDERPLQVGDLFTAAELLPVAKKLIGKVENPGSGKGIVSSAKSPYHLADKLFEQFFLTKKRLVTLTIYDLIGLDALQALALSGEPAYLRSHYVETSTRPAKMIYFNGQTIGVKNKYKFSKYRLLSKNAKAKFKKHLVRTQAEKKADEAAKLLKAKKFLRHALKAIQNGRNMTHLKKSLRATIKQRTEKKSTKVALKKSISTKVVNKNYTTKAKPMGPPKTNPSKKIVRSNTAKGKRPLCTWKYLCTNPTDLDTCHLKTACEKKYRKHANKDDIDALGIAHNPDEHTRHIQQFRKMIGITLVDEEVEKILETRVINLRPSPQGGKEMERIESLSEYFNNIILAQHSTTPYKSEEKIDTVTDELRGPDSGPKSSASSEGGAPNEDSSEELGPQKLNKLKSTTTRSPAGADQKHREDLGKSLIG